MPRPCTLHLPRTCWQWEVTERALSNVETINFCLFRQLGGGEGGQGPAREVALQRGAVSA